MARRTIVKICGLTRIEDARLAHEAGADWLGMIVLGESPRRISIEAAREISTALDGAITVGVGTLFVAQFGASSARTREAESGPLAGGCSSRRGCSRPNSGAANS